MAQPVSTEVYSRDAVYRQMRRQIIDFTLLPGELLSESTLAAQMHTSRTPVREAIARLACEHCVEVFPQRGTQVSRISMQLMHHAAFLRLVLEREVVEHLCRTGLTDGQAEELEQSLARQRALYAERQSYELLEEDLRMHGLFYRYCGRERAGDAFTATTRRCVLRCSSTSFRWNRRATICAASTRSISACEPLFAIERRRSGFGLPPGRKRPAGPVFPVNRPIIIERK